jgi:hypothetical protein
MVHLHKKKVSWAWGSIVKSLNQCQVGFTCRLPANKAVRGLKSVSKATKDYGTLFFKGKR